MRSHRLLSQCGSIMLVALVLTASTLGVLPQVKIDHYTVSRIKKELLLTPPSRDTLPLLKNPLGKN